MSKIYESCPNCGRTYDEIDYDYQICSLCGYYPERFEMCKFYNSKLYDSVKRMKKVTKGIHWHENSFSYIIEHFNTYNFN